MDDEIDLVDLWRLLWAGRWLIAATTMSISVMALAVSYLMTPKYRVDVILAPVSEEGSTLSALGGQLGGLAGLVGGLGSGSSNLNEALATLVSRDFIERFIEDHNLLPVLFAKRWDAQARRWDVDSVEDEPTLSDGFYFFRKRVLTVTEYQKTGLTLLSVEWKDPTLAAEWARLLVDRINGHMRQRSIDEASRSLEYLQSEISGTKAVEIQQAAYRLVENQLKTIMVAKSRDEYVFRVVDPPKVPDPDDYVKPRRALMTILGLGLGLGVGVLWVLFRSFLGTARQDLDPNR